MTIYCINFVAVVFYAIAQWKSSQWLVLRLTNSIKIGIMKKIIIYSSRKVEDKEKTLSFCT